jgi:hypothetical protein
MVITIFLIIFSGFKVHTDATRICGYRYCVDEDFKFKKPLEIIAAVSLSLLTLLNAFMVLYFWSSIKYFVDLKTNLALSSQQEPFSTLGLFVIFSLKFAIFLRLVINLTLNPLTVVMIVSDIRSKMASFELTFMILRGFLSPIRDFIELNLFCYMIREQDAKRTAQEHGTTRQVLGGSRGKRSQ